MSTQSRHNLSAPHLQWKIEQHPRRTHRSAQSGSSTTLLTDTRRKYNQCLPQCRGKRRTLGSAGGGARGEVGEHVQSLWARAIAARAQTGWAGPRTCTGGVRRRRGGHTHTHTRHATDTGTHMYAQEAGRIAAHPPPGPYVRVRVCAARARACVCVCLVCACVCVCVCVCVSISSDLPNREQREARGALARPRVLGARYVGMRATRCLGARNRVRASACPKKPRTCPEKPPRGVNCTSLAEKTPETVTCPKKPSKLSKITPSLGRNNPGG